jgi:hypothetical protein
MNRKGSFAAAGRRSPRHPVRARRSTRFAVAALLAVMVAGCGPQWRTTVWSPERSCEDFGGANTGNGNCSYNP